MGTPMMTLQGPELVATAERIARAALLGRRDENGAPAIAFARQVAAEFNAATQPWEAATAWLQSAVDGSTVSASDLISARIPYEVVTAVVLLNARTDDATAPGQADRIRANRLALAVKAAELAVLTNPERSGRLSPAARERLEHRTTALRDALDLWAYHATPA